MELYIPPGPRLGNNVIDGEGVSKSFGDKLLYENLNFKLPPAGIVGVIGPNGAGKTTLFRMIMGQENPDNGTFNVGQTVKMLIRSCQTRMDIDTNKTIWEQITDSQELVEVGGRQMNSRHMWQNLILVDQIKIKVGVLSGGEE